MEGRAHGKIPPDNHRGSQIRQGPCAPSLHDSKGGAKDEIYSRFAFDGMSLPEKDGEQAGPSTLNQRTDCEA